MSTPVRSGQTIDDFIESRRQLLLSDSSTSTPPQQPMELPREIPEENRNLIMEGLKGGFGLVKKGINKAQDIRQENLSSMSPEELQQLEKLKDTSDPGLLKYLTPGGAGTVSGAGRAGVLRKLSPFRRKGKKLAAEVSKIEDKVPKPDVMELLGDSNVISNLKKKGHKVWSKNLGGKNPSQFHRFLDEIPVAERAIVQRGALESLRENIANVPRLTADMQRNLLSPAGRARLEFAFEGLPPEAINRFISLVEKGQHQNVTRWLALVPIVIPLARKLGWDIIGSILP